MKSTAKVRERKQGGGGAGGDLGGGRRWPRRRHRRGRVEAGPTASRGEGDGSARQQKAAALELGEDGDGKRKNREKRAVDGKRKRLKSDREFFLKLFIYFNKNILFI